MMMGAKTFHPHVLYKIQLILFTLLFTLSAEGKIQSDLTPLFIQYASENSPTIQITDKTNFFSDHFIGTGTFFFESGPRGTWSFDPDPFRYQTEWGPGMSNFFWIGRSHPLQNQKKLPIEPTSASGSIWAQNQIDALNPRVSGWIGAGYSHSFHPHWKMSLTYSPIFIPTFSPRLGFTERGDLNPARFARPPPNMLENDGVRLPIRYQLRLSQISELIFRHQVFSGVTYDADSLESDLFFFTAPKPDPVPLTDSTLSVSDSGLNAKVSVIPQFPREYWGGFRATLKKVLFQPTIEFMQNLEIQTHRLVSIAGKFGPTRSQAQFGVLSHVGKRSDPPAFSDLLLFLKLPIALSQHLSARTLLESTLFSGKRSLYWAQELELSLHSQFSTLIGVKVLAGEDRSFFGGWRNESSICLGVKKSW